MNNQMNQDLNWLAFRYVADELSPDERHAFEQRLADDQEAREEVARAVELAQAVAFVTAEVRPIRLPFRRWVQPAGWAAAASLLIGVLIYGTGHLTHGRPSLATAWSSIQRSLFDVDNNEFADSEDVFALLTEDEADLTVPAWLIEAVSSSMGIDGSWEET